MLVGSGPLVTHAGCGQCAYPVMLMAIIFPLDTCDCASSFAGRAKASVSQKMADRKTVSADRQQCVRRRAPGHQFPTLAPVWAPWSCRACGLQEEKLSPPWHSGTSCLGVGSTTHCHGILCHHSLPCDRSRGWAQATGSAPSGEASAGKDDMYSRYP